MTEGVRRLLAYQCNRARGYYRRAHALLPPEDRRSLVAAEIMGGIYRSVLDRIERADYDVFGETIRVPRPRRAAIAAIDLGAVARGIACRRLTSSSSVPASPG